MLWTAIFLLITFFAFCLGRVLMSRRQYLEGPTLPGKIFGPFTQAVACTLQPQDAAYERVAMDLVRAGWYHKTAALNFFAGRNAAILLWCIACSAFLALGGAEVLNGKIAAAAFGVALLIYGLPRVVLSSRAEARAKRIQESLPDALDMITMVMSGGLTIQQALQRVVGQMDQSHPDLATELAIIHRQSETGSFDQAMQNFARRMDVSEITGLTSMMRHNNRIGGKAVDAMRDFADSARHGRQIRAEEQGNKASIKLLMPVVFCLAPPIYIMLLGPALLELRGFMNRENRSGGVLQPTTSLATNPGLPTIAPRRADASTATELRLGNTPTIVARAAEQFEARRR